MCDTNYVESLGLELGGRDLEDRRESSEAVSRLRLVNLQLLANGLVCSDARKTGVDGVRPR